METLSEEELKQLALHLDDYMGWAETWHRQAGGYTASDTSITIMRMDRWAKRLKEITGEPEVSLRRGKEYEP